MGTLSADVELEVPLVVHGCASGTLHMSGRTSDLRVHPRSEDAPCCSSKVALSPLVKSTKSLFYISLCAQWYGHSLPVCSFFW